MQNVVACHFLLEDHGKTSGMNQLDASETIPEDKSLLKDVNRLLFVHTHFAPHDLEPIMKIINNSAMKLVTCLMILGILFKNLGFSRVKADKLVYGLQHQRV